DGTYQSFFHDITVRKQAENAIANEKERLSVTLRSIGDGVITTDIRGRIHLMNRVAEHLTGWTQQEAQDRPLAEVFHIINEQTREPAEPPVGKVLISAGTAESDIPALLVARDRSEHLVSSCGSPIMDKNNTVIGTVLVFRDMTEKTKLLEISQNNQKLEALGVLAGGIAHDFNNLLGGIFGFMELALAKCHEPLVADFLTSALGTIKRARGLTQQLLTFAKGGTPVRTTTSLFPFIQQSAQFALSGSNVSCRCQVPDGLWPCHIDVNQIGQVIDNLVINAQQAMPMGGEVLISAVNLTLEKQNSPGLPAGKYVQVSVADSGIGIPHNLLPRIFDPFFTTKSKGQGLGLATSHSIIRRHTGAILVDSEPGKGSTFHLYLPAAPAPLPRKDAAAQVRHAGQGRFLIMDDEKSVRDILTAFLQHLGYQVVAMADGRSALSYFLSEHQAGRPFAGLILDLTIPGGLGGKDIIADLRAVAPDLPVIVFSGYAEDPIMANPVEFGFTASLRKPFLKCELEEILNRHIRTSGSQA
ncbi:MAG TPA: ATP-binding protein, partial [Candidatus Ozemobacteraceae bacterium]|nr:ATP-binding protein [Candidatus Ozemobacteraceae bacterium]